MRCLIPLLLLWTIGAKAQTPRKLLVVSVDGLDQRYLTDAGKLGLRIPNLRKMMAEGEWSQGVIGVVPTVTWPSHTTLITGVDPAVHGIRGNRRPRSEGGDYYWDVSLLKARTLLDAMKAAGRTTATITWPVTVNAPSTYNLPEYFQKRQGGSMDTRSIESKSNPTDLVANITAMYPSFPQEWMDDRTRTLAVQYLLKTRQPDLILVHLVDLDSEAHENGPFTREANAVLERTDELIGDMMRTMSSGYSFVLVSDHGFEEVKEEINLGVVSKARNVTGVALQNSLAIAETPVATAFLRQLQSEGRYGIGREIPKEELSRFQPDLAKNDAVFESARGYLFGRNEKGDERSVPREIGNHGHWPMRYRAVFLVWGPGIAPLRLPEISMKEIARRLAELLGIPFTPGLK